MQLVGMLDSPYVRRVAVTMNLLGIPYQHRSVSLFSAYDQFRLINPVVKAPTLVCDDGEVLMDSSLILEYLGLFSTRTLMPASRSDIERALRIEGLALVACEKSVQLVYERNLRPPDKLHEPWVARIEQQLVSAYAELEIEARKLPWAVGEMELSRADISAAVAWRFTQFTSPQIIEPSIYVSLAAHAAALERLPCFLKAPIE